jgi:acetyl esterase/lipase/protocatechuate 3,4-dioxygenase beta subunit
MTASPTSLLAGFSRSWTGLPLVLGLWACGGETGPPPDGGPPAEVELVSGGGQTAAVGKTLGDAIVARVTDDEGRAVADVVVTFAAPADGGSFSPASARTDEAGEVRTVWTLGSRAGELSGSIGVEGLAPVPVPATALAGAPARLAFETIPQAAVAGVVFDPPVVVMVQDEFGNPVSGSSPQIHLQLNKGFLAGSVTGEAVDGVAIFDDLHIDQAGSGFVLTATADGLTSSESAAFPVATGTAAELLLVAGDGQDAAAGTAVAVAPTVEVRDASGNVVAGVSVTFAVTGGAGSVSPGSVTTGTDGRAAPTVWTLGTGVGANTLRATTPALPGASVEFTAVAIPGPVDPERSTVSASPATVLTGVSSTVTVTARDAFDNPIAGLGVALSATGPGNTLTQPPVTGANGTTSGGLRSTVAGTKTVSVEIDGVTLQEAATVVVESPPAVGSVEVSPGQVHLVDGETTTLAATVLDEDGAPMPDAEVEWSSSDTDVATVDAGGVVTARGAGAAIVTAESGGRSGSADVSVSFGEGTLLDRTYCNLGDKNKMDVYVPSASMPRPLPVVMHVHGGGWISGSKSSGLRFMQLKDDLLSRGYLVVSIDYRLGPADKFPAQIQDVKCAVRHLRARAALYGLDPDRIGAWGGSAGGQLVSLLGTADASAGFDDVGGFQGESSEVQAVVAISAITDFTTPEELLDDYHRAFETWPDPTSPEMIQASPVSHVSAGDAPFFFIVGDEDQLVMPEQSVRMNQLLQGADVPSSLLRVLHADHDLQPTGPTPIDPSSAVINSQMVEFFDQHLQ